MQSQLQLLSFRIQAFTKNEILAMIDPADIESIKAKDEHPFFQVYSICHEGVSNPKLLGDTSRPITWTRAAVQSIKNVITKGVNFFFRHNEDNSTDGRKSLGRIVADTQKEIDGTLHHLVVAYHPPEVRDEAKKCDVCSQEGVWNFVEKAGDLVASTIDKLTGIALSNSAIEKPAFDGAKRLGMVQAFENEGGDMPNDDNTDVIRGIRQQIKDLRIFPWQLFNVTELQNDRQFSNIDEMKDLFSDYANVKSDNVSIKTKLEEALKTIETLEATNKQLVRSEQLINAKQRLDAIVKESNLTDKQVNFIDSRFNDKSVEDLSDDGLKNYVTAEVNTYKEFAKYYDTTPEPNINNQPTDGVDTSDYSNADNNPLIDKE